MGVTILDGTIPVFGTHADNTIEQLRDVATRAVRCALMADGHLGYIMPVGGVAAYRNQVSVAGVGFDIACGNAAIRTDLSYADIAPHRDELADLIHQTISFGVGRTNKADDAPMDDPLFDDPAWQVWSGDQHMMTRMMSKARNQLGTVGSGNHYVDVFVDEADHVWVGVHFGSRGFGHGIATGAMAVGAGLRWTEKTKETETLVALDSALGHDYWHLMNLAGRYAYVGREWVTRKVVALLGGTEQELVHNHHNFAWKEMHDGEELVIVRKGATPAFPGQRGFVGGSMGDNAVILEGVEDGGESQRAALFSTVHGAGRVMSRTEAKGKIKKGRVVREGKVTQPMMDAWLAERDVVLRGGGLDESPHVYRRLPDVLREQGDTVRVLHTLTPVIVVMAGGDEFDPYKD